MFGAAPGSTLFEFRAGGVIDQGKTVVRASRVPDTELLLQVVVGTGPNARPTCGGTAPSGSDPGKNPVPDPGPGPGGGAAPGSMRIPKPARDPRMFDGKVRLTLRCAPGPDCAGVLSLRARGKRIGRRAFRFDGGETDGVSVKLSKAGRRMARRAGKLKVTARVTIGDKRVSRTVTVHG